MTLMQKYNLVADIGGTNARFALVDSERSGISRVRVLSGADYPSIGDAIRDYLAMEKIDQVDAVCLAVAGLVGSNEIDLPNNHWRFKQDELASLLNAPLSIINDWTAQALSLNYIEADKISLISANTKNIDPTKTTGVKAFIGPGTGLGMAALLESGDTVVSEGGHVSFAPVDSHQMALLDCLTKRYPRVSNERVLSGMGLANLYWANAELLGLSERELPAKEVVAGAHAGDKICLQAVHDFVSIAGAVAGDLALLMGAKSVYICGGITPKLGNLLDISVFQKAFKNKGRFNEVCANIPVFLVDEPYSGLLGCIAKLP